MNQVRATPLIVIGAGRHGKEVCAYAIDMGLPLAGAVDEHRERGPWHLTQVIGGLAQLREVCAGHSEVAYITAVGSNRDRQRLVHAVDALGIANLKAMQLRHPLSWSGPQVDIGAGTLLAPGALVTTSARVGQHVIMNVKASVSHDCDIGDFCNLNPGATICGDVAVGEGAYIGAGATVINNVKIGAWTIVGAGAMVTHDLPAGVTAVGVPARIIRAKEAAP